ncbi:SDR family oxidoreductase [bacterium]|jgi:UDP-glucose 4-epimerase|nr:SDR family oxidoreductase [bacterium]
MKKILLIGSEGYIGSYLKTKIGCNPFDLSLGLDYKNISIDEIKNYDILILLAGHSSVASCANNQLAAFKNNVDNFSNLLYKIEKAGNPIKFIYASSSSVYGQTGAGIVTENFSDFIPHNTYDITKHFIDILAKDSKVEYYGLRFGTVCGYSPVLRTDVMINSMVRSAKDLGHVKLYIKEVNRPILGMNDLGRSIECIINERENKKGIYNLASFNSTAEYIASVVSNLCDVPIVEMEFPQEVSNAKEQTITYDFAISSEKFSKSFQFEFQDSIESITKSLIQNWKEMKKINRTTKLIYETKN